MACGECCLVGVGNGSRRCEKVQKRCRSLYSSGLSIYRMTRPNWPLRHRADSGAGLSVFPIVGGMWHVAGGGWRAAGGVRWPKS